MKKVLLILFCMVTLSSMTFAEESKKNHQSQSIRLEFHTSDKSISIHRTPINLNVEVFYYPEINCITVEGEGDAEVNLYFDGRLVDHSDALNTTFYASESDGVYMLEIIADSWSAIGYIEV